MNQFQAIWYDQVRSDHAVLNLLRQHGALPCHQLHYLQMVTEKLGKAYFWRTNRPPRKSHASFIYFFKALGDRSKQDRDRIARLLKFHRFEDFQNWGRAVAPLAYQLERLAPALAGDDGPNPEYPWPRTNPLHAPASFDFDLWSRLTCTSRGRQMLDVVDCAVERFAEYG